MNKLRPSIKALPGIYGIRNTITKRVYIGSAENVRSRFSGHLSALLKFKHPNKELQEDFNIYGLTSLAFVVFKYKPKNKLHSESVVLKLLLNNNIGVYNYTMPGTNNYFRIADKHTTKYILRHSKLKRTYTNVTNLLQFYKHNKAYGCPAITKLYEMVLDKTEFRNWTIEIDSENSEEIIQTRQDKKGLKPMSNKVYYTRKINWKITNVLTKQSIVVPNLMAWCKLNNVHYNRFQRYQDTAYVYQGVWKLEKV